MADFTNVCKAADIQPGAMKNFQIDGEDVAVGNVDGKFCAFSNLCPHQGASFAGGFGAIYNGEIACMLHDSAFSLETGQVTDGPSYDALTIYTVRVEGDDLLVGKE